VVVSTLPLGEFSAMAALDRYVEANASIREPDQKWHPSSIFACDRKAIYEYRGVEHSNPRTERSKRVLYIGTRWHEIVQAAIREHSGADEVHTEVPIDFPFLNIVGHADVLQRFGSRWELTEVKSISSRAFKYLNAPKPDHVLQAMTYAYVLREIGAPTVLLDRRLGNALDSVRFVYCSKDDLQIAEFMLPWNDAYKNQIEAKIAALDTYALDPLSLPPRLPLEKGKKNWLCADYCEFRDRCWNVDATEVAPDPDIF